MKLVKLDDDVWVNPEHVVAVEAEKGKTYVYLSDGERTTVSLGLDVYEVLDRLDPVPTLTFNARTGNPAEVGRAIYAAIKAYYAERDDDR